MDGVAIARAVMVGDAGVAALVPASRIYTGETLPQSIELPAILIGFVSGVDRNIPHPSATVFRTDRVQIEGHAATHPAREELMMAIWKAIANNPRAADGVTLHTDARGPDILSEAMVRVGIQDAKVTYPKER